VILDWKMPDIDGIETIHRIRTEVNSSVPILLISAYDLVGYRGYSEGSRANGFVSKPLFRSKLYDKINELLGTEVKSVERRMTIPICRELTFLLRRIMISTGRSYPPCSVCSGSRRSAPKTAPFVWIKLNRQQKEVMLSYLYGYTNA
jgi:DNA-binding response OmpR family regulator